MVDTAASEPNEEEENPVTSDQDMAEVLEWTRSLTAESRDHTQHY